MLIASHSTDVLSGLSGFARWLAIASIVIAVPAVGKVFTNFLGVFLRRLRRAESAAGAQTDVGSDIKIRHSTADAPPAREDNAPAEAAETGTSPDDSGKEH
jgi:hypothetical protein